MDAPPAHDHSEQTAAVVDNLIPYARFLERRAWRLKIASDRHRLDQESIDIQSSIAEALTTEAVLIVNPEQSTDAW
jgi:hypothetical protein